MSKTYDDWPHRSPQHRATAAGHRGVVACAHPWAAQAGLDALKAGGNAVDAVVTMAAALAVVEPYSSGAGGGGFMVVHAPGLDRPVALDFVGTTPKAAEPSQYDDASVKDSGIRSAIVPGAVAGWLAALDRFGRMDRSAVLAPAIRFAEQGFPVSRFLHKGIRFVDDTVGRSAKLASVVRPQGRPLLPGALMRQEDLARSLRLIAETGAEGFYKGPIAEEIVRFAQEEGGILVREDFGAYRPTWQACVDVAYNGVEIFCPPPPSRAVEFLLSMKTLEGLDIEAPPFEGRYLHALAETFKRSWFECRAASTFTRDEIAKKLSASHAEEMRTTIDVDQAWQPGESGAGARSEGTTHMVAMDAEGFAAACTQTLGGRGGGRGFGSGLIFGDTGIILNNLMRLLDLDPQSHDPVAPGRSIPIRVSPSLLWREGRVVGAIGTPGAWGILQTTPQLLLNYLQHGFDVQAAIEAPRFRLDDGFGLRMERRFSDDAMAYLAARGHAIELLPEWSSLVGGAHGAVLDDATGCFFAGADPRRDGMALGF